MNPPVTAVFFDLYGTLLVYANMPAAWNAWTDEFYALACSQGLTETVDRFARRCKDFFSAPPPAPTDVTITVYERRIERLCSSAGLSPERDAIRIFATRTTEVWQRHIPLDPEAIPLLKELKRRKMILGVITNFDHPPHVRDLLKRFGIASYFHPVIISGEVGIKKPDPAIFHLALAPAALDPSSVLFIGDAPEDIDGALAAQLRPVLLARDRTQIPGGVAIISSLAEVLACVE